MSNIDELLREAEENLWNNEIKPVPYIGSWRGFERTCIGVKDGELYINNYKKNSRALYRPTDEELNELEDTLEKVLKLIMKEEEVKESHHELVREKLEEITDEIYLERSVCSHCGTIMAHEEKIEENYDEKYSVGADNVYEHSCEASEKGELTKPTDYVRLKKLYPEVEKLIHQKYFKKKDQMNTNPKTPLLRYSKNELLFLRTS